MVGANFLIGCFGISLGFHRLLCHRSFIAKPWVRNVMAFLGTLSFNGGPVSWVAVHRSHHLHTDQAGDPHSSLRGFWWSHIGWIMHHRPNGFRFSESKKMAEDVAQVPFVAFLERHFMAVNIGVFVIAALLIRRADILFWIFPVRIVVQWHLTYLINSYAHGARFFKAQAPTQLRNSRWLSWVSYGEGLHLNHHLRPASPSFSDSQSGKDFGYLVLLSFQSLGWIELKK